MSELDERQKDFEARAKVAAAFAAVWSAVAAASLAKSLPPWLQVTASGLALAGLIAALRFNVDARSAALERERLAREREQLAQERERLSIVRRAPVARIEAVDPTSLGFDAAAQDVLPGGKVPEYVPRHVDEDLRAAVSEALRGDGQWLVVVIGASKIGKSRSLFEAIRHSGEGHGLQFIAPADSDALRTRLMSAAEEARLTPAVMWLDDLELFLNDGITLAILRGWHADVPGRFVAATYGGKGSDLIGDSAKPKSSLTTSAAEVLQHARTIAMTATTSGELAKLRDRVSAEHFAALERHGLAAYLVAAPALEHKIVTGRHSLGEPACPHGVAVVRAAIDWARCGRTDAIADQTLRRLWRHYVPPGASAPDDDYAAALAWALRPVAGTVALLHGAGSYQAFDYVVQVERSRSASSPPDAAWAAALDGVTDAQALAVGTAAYNDGRLADAHVALTRARQSSIDQTAAIAGQNLLIVLRALNRSEDELVLADELVERFSDATEPPLRELVANALFTKGHRLGLLNRCEDALSVYGELVARLADATEPALRGKVANALFNKGAMLSQLDRSEDSIAAYGELVTRFADATEPALQERVADALLNKGVALWTQDRVDEALVVYDELVARFSAATEPALRKRVAQALGKRALVLGTQRRFEEAEAAYDELLARFAATESELCETVADALTKMGGRLDRLPRCEEALADCDRYVRLLAAATEPALRESVAERLVSKALLLGALDRREDALLVHDQLVARFSDADEPALRDRVAGALINKVLILSALDRVDEAVAASNELAARFENAADPKLRDSVAQCGIVMEGVVHVAGNKLVQKAARLAELGRHHEELAVYDKVVARFAHAAQLAAHEHVAGALANKAIRLGNLGRYEEELAVYDESVERFADESELSLRLRAAHALFNKAIRLGKLNRDEDIVAAYEEVEARFKDAPEKVLREAVEMARVLSRLPRNGR